MRWKGIFIASVLLVIPYGAIPSKGALAQSSEAFSADYSRFVDRYLCSLTALLTLLGQSDQDKNQYAMISPRSDDSSYVQCLFRLDEPIFCEAASYFLRNPRGGPALYRISDEKRKQLESVNFTFRPRGNFYVEIPRPEDENYEPLARFMLKTLYDVYGVRFLDPVKMQGPQTLTLIVALCGCSDPVISTLQPPTPISPGSK